jgi:hypothetical protein
MTDSPSRLVLAFRMSERLLIVAGGILSTFLGYRLFTLGITAAQGEASVAAVGVTLRNFGPGLFFAALGAFILVVAMRAAVRTEDSNGGGGRSTAASMAAASDPFYERHTVAAEAPSEH